MNCPTCDKPGYSGVCPPEPPVGTWVKDRDGNASVRNRDGWAPALYGFFGCGRWEAMWAAHGPLTPCGPYGRELQ